MKDGSMKEFFDERNVETLVLLHEHLIFTILNLN